MWIVLRANRMLWAMLRIWLLVSDNSLLTNLLVPSCSHLRVRCQALLALFAAVSRANTEVLTTIAQYTDEVCNDTTAAYMDSSWTMVSQNVSANSEGGFQRHHPSGTLYP